MAIPLTKANIAGVMPDLSARQAKGLFEKMQFVRRNVCESLNGRLLSAKSPEAFAEQVKLYGAMQGLWSCGGSTYRFEEVDEFSTGYDGKKLVWSGHSEVVDDKGVKLKAGSKPKLLFRVYEVGEDGVEKLLPLNVGFSGMKELNRRFGVTERLGGRLATKEGKIPSGGVISAFVWDKSHPDYERLKEAGVRDKVENSLMAMMKASGKDVILSSILFNIRENPFAGLYMALRGHYTRGPHTVLPVSGVFLPSKREKLPHTKDARDGKNNGVFWVAYLNEETMDLSRIPKIDLSPLNGHELQGYKNPSIQAMQDAFKRLRAYVNAHFGEVNLPHIIEGGLLGNLQPEIITAKGLLGKVAAGLGFHTVMHDVVSSPDRERLAALNAQEATSYLNGVLKKKGSGALVFKPDRVKAEQMPDGSIRHKVIRRLDSKKTVANLDAGIPDRFGVGREFYYLSYDDNVGLCYKSPNNALLRLPGRASQLKYVPKDLLTEKTLMARDSQARTPLHTIAANGELGLLPKGLLTRRMLLSMDGSGATPLSEMVRAGNLKQLLVLAPELIKDELFNRPCHDRGSGPRWYRGGVDLVDVAVCAGTADCLPDSVIDGAMSDYERSKRLRSFAGKAGQLAAFEELEAKFEKKRLDHLDHAAPETFTQELLLSRNSKGQTLVELMAGAGKLGLVPDDALEEALTGMVETDDLSFMLNANVSARIGAFFEDALVPDI